MGNIFNRENNFSMAIRFSCKCGNCNFEKFIRKQNKDNMEVLCVICERKYIITIISEELKIHV